MLFIDIGLKLFKKKSTLNIAWWENEKAVVGALNENQAYLIRLNVGLLIFHCRRVVSLFFNITTK